jgi:aminoacyl tRNA synthase complex-interacting multifunctional protein 1
MAALQQLDSMIAKLEADLGQGSAAPAPPAAQQKGGEGKKQEKKPKKEKAPKAPKAPKAAPADPNQPSITKIEFRVGLIVKAWKHETADKLYCEEIDVGEETGPRQIASGLVPHYPLEAMQNRRVVVMANLKAKNLVGFKSHGMVCCAAKEGAGAEGGEKVEFVEPPAGAAVGEVLTFAGLTGDYKPVTPAQVDKKKVLVDALPDFIVNAQGAVEWQGAAFVSSAGPVTAPTLRDCVVR